MKVGDNVKVRPYRESAKVIHVREFPDVEVDMVLIQFSNKLMKWVSPLSLYLK